MTISLPGSGKRGLSSLLGRKAKTERGKPTAKKQLNGEQVARLFDKKARAAKTVAPAKLNDSEKQDSARLSTLRGALYSDD